MMCFMFTAWITMQPVIIVFNPVQVPKVFMQREQVLAPEQVSHYHVARI